MLQSAWARMLRLGQCSGPRGWRSRTLLALLVTVSLMLGALLMDKRRSYGAARLAWMAPGKCVPKTNIAFLKSHKCASSAIQNILFRYGLKHNLHFALPDRGNYFGGGKEFNSAMVRLSPLNKFEPNIFTMHTKWNHDEVKKVMPEDTVYFTIVREPTQLFLSLFVYGRIEEKKDMTLEEFVRQEAVDANRTFGYLGYNQMTWDFGMPFEGLSNLTAVQEMIERADDQFGLVLLAERMEESLVLLAKFLCWELKDMIVLRVNSLRDEFKQSLSPAAEKLLKHKLTPDYMIYRHFAAKFERQVETYGRRRMAAEVERLREMKALLEDTCGFVPREATMLNGTQRPWSDKVDGFVGGNGDGCNLYSLPELPFIDKLRKKQMKEVIKRFGSMGGPPLNAIPFVMGEDGKVSEKDLERLKKTLVHKDNTKRTIGLKKATRTGVKFVTPSGGDDGDKDNVGGEDVGGVHGGEDVGDEDVDGVHGGVGNIGGDENVGGEDVGGDIHGGVDKIGGGDENVGGEDINDVPGGGDNGGDKNVGGEDINDVPGGGGGDNGGDKNVGGEDIGSNIPRGGGGGHGAGGGGHGAARGGA